MTSFRQLIFPGIVVLATYLIYVFPYYALYALMSEGRRFPLVGAGRDRGFCSGDYLLLPLSLYLVADKGSLSIREWGLASLLFGWLVSR